LGGVSGTSYLIQRRLNGRLLLLTHASTVALDKTGVYGFYSIDIRHNYADKIFVLVFSELSQAKH
jgi:hypothetical protein